MGVLRQMTSECRMIGEGADVIIVGKKKAGSLPGGMLGCSLRSHFLHVPRPRGKSNEDISTAALLPFQ